MDAVAKARGWTKAKAIAEMARGSKLMVDALAAVALDQQRLDDAQDAIDNPDGFPGVWAKVVAGVARDLEPE